MTDWLRHATTLLMVVVLWLCLAALATTPRVSIRSPGRIASAPADWWITVTVDPHPENRQLILIADGQPGEYRRSDYALEGEKAAKIRQVWFKALPQGCYYFSAAVATTSTVIASTTFGPVAVIGLEGNPCQEP